MYEKFVYKLKHFDQPVYMRKYNRENIHTSLFSIPIRNDVYCEKTRHVPHTTAVHVNVAHIQLYRILSSSGLRKFFDTRGKPSVVIILSPVRMQIKRN